MHTIVTKNWRGQKDLRATDATCHFIFHDSTTFGLNLRFFWLIDLILYLGMPQWNAIIDIFAGQSGLTLTKIFWCEYIVMGIFLIANSFEYQESVFYLAKYIYLSCVSLDF